MDEYEGLRRFGREVDKLAGKMRETRASSEVEKMKCGPDGREKASYESLHGATGIERLRGLTEFWRANRLDDIVEQIEREHGCDSDAIENVRLIVGRVITDMERHVSGHEGMEDSPVARWARELREALTKNEVEKMKCDPAEDVSMRAYDLLPEEDRDAIGWVRARGGLVAVTMERSNLWGIVGETCRRLGVECVGDLTTNAQNIWREIGGLKRLLGESVPRAACDRHIARRQRQIDESHAALRRRNARIAELERAARIHRFHDAINSKCYVELLEKYEELLTLFDNQRASLDGLTAAIDEMRPRLMPEGMEWPKFESGEPVRIGDQFAEHGGCENVVDSVEVGDCWFKIHGFDGAAPRYNKRASVKRHAPKVLDADGVEIREGDTLWHVETGEQCKVVEVDSRSVSVDFRADGDGTKYTGSVLPVNLTHRAPVPAADGGPLREGETVWHEDGTKLRVLGFLNDAVDIVKVERVSGPTNWCECQNLSLTHERPDSWERLEEDAKKLTCDYFGHDGGETCETCPGYMDSTPQGGRGCRYAQMADLVRRAKKLAERGQ